MDTLLSLRATIRPYLDPESSGNMGLERHNQVLFDTIRHTEPLTYLTFMGRDRYLTGLDEFAPEVDAIAHPDEKAARIKEIRTTVAFLEPRLGGSNGLDPADKDFWAKVQILRPDNHEFWKEIKIECSNDPVSLAPKTDLKDLLRILAIKAGGFSIVAPTLEDARKRPNVPKFFMDEQQATLSLKTEIKKLRNKAGAVLEKLFDRDKKKLMLMCKVLDANSLQYRNSTNPDILYQNMDLWLDGALDGNLNKVKNINRFLEVDKLDGATLKIQAVVKDATLLKFISRRSDGAIYDMQNSNLLGRNIEEVVEHLKNPLHETTLASLLSRVEEKWN